MIKYNKQTVSAKIHSRKRKSSDHKLRSLKYNVVTKVGKNQDNQNVGLEAAII